MHLTSLSLRAIAVVLLASSCGGASAGGAADPNRTPDGKKIKVSSFGCVAPKPVMMGGEPTGYLECQGGWRARESVVECPSLTPRAEGCESVIPAQDQCKTDGECTARPNGYCATGGRAAPRCECRFGCTTDDECPTGEICNCGFPTGTCVPAGCTSDDDCPGTNRCASYVDRAGCGELRFACQQPGDSCASDADCKKPKRCSRPSPDAPASCQEAECYVGDASEAPRLAGEPGHAL